MDWNQITLSILGLLGSGSIIYLVVDKLVLSKKEKTEVKTDVIGNGAHLIDLYKEVDTIVESKTKPIVERLDTLTERFNQVACFRNCEYRIRNEKESDSATPFKRKYCESCKKE